MRNEAKTWLTPHKCPVCGKTFYPAAYHAYKDARNPYRLVCTYPCYREAERLHEAEMAAKPRRKSGPKPKTKSNEET